MINLKKSARKKEYADRQREEMKKAEAKALEMHKKLEAELVILKTETDPSKILDIVEKFISEKYPDYAMHRVIVDHVQNLNKIASDLTPN